MLSYHDYVLQSWISYLQIWPQVSRYGTTCGYFFLSISPHMTQLMSDTAQGHQSHTCYLLA